MTTNAPLSAEAIQQYQEEGYLIPDCQLPESRLNELMEAVERVLVTNPEVRPEKLVSVHISGLNQEGVRGDDAFMELAKDPMIVDCVEQLIGPDIILWGCQLFCKPGTDGMEVPMHQDGAYWPIRPLATCTVWVALDHVSEENGCMRVVPGSHRHQSLSHQKESREDLVLNQRVNAVAPAFVRTPLTQSLLAEDGMEEKLLARTPLGRLVETHEVADAIHFLASDAAAMITGHTLPVDGGWVAQ